MTFIGPIARRFLLLAGGAVALAACDGGSRDAEIFGPAVVSIGDALAAEVDGSPIYVSDVAREARAQGLVEANETLRPGTALFDQVLEELIDQRLLALEAVRRDLHDTEDARRRLATARERIMGNILVEAVVDQAVTEEAVRAMYEEQVKLVELGDEVRARHIVVETQEQAEELYGQVTSGADFEELALEHSVDENTRFEGGDLGYFTPDMMTPPFARVAFETEVGGVSEPFKTDFGWHVLKVEDRRAEERPSFEEMRPRIVRFMTFDEVQELMATMRARTDIRRFDTATRSPLEPLGEGEPAR